MTRPTLPGIILGLLRRGSPVVSTIDGTRGVLCHHDEPDAGSTPSPLGWFVADLDVEAISVWRYDEIALDLTDPTGRAHAAWWLAARGSYYVPAQRSFDDLTDEAWITIWRRIKDGSDLTDVQIDALRRVVLAVAGLEEPVESAVVVGTVAGGAS